MFVEQVSLEYGMNERVEGRRLLEVDDSYCFENYMRQKYHIYLVNHLRLHSGRAEKLLNCSTRCGKWRTFNDGTHRVTKPICRITFSRFIAEIHQFIRLTAARLQMQNR